MPIYVIIDASDVLTEVVEENFDQAARINVTHGVWFVRSPRLSSGEVARDLGISVDGLNGIVVTAKHYSGVAGGSVVEKLSAWEAES